MMSRNPAALAVGDLRGLVGGVVPGPPVDVPVGRDLFAAHLLSAPAEHRAAVPESHTVLHVRLSAGLAFAKVQLKRGHQPLEFPENLDVIAVFFTLKLPVFLQESLVRDDVFRLPRLPVLALEAVVNAFQFIGRRPH